MTRISLVEAYDDKDVITQIAKMKDKLDSIPDDADLSNCVLKVNNQIIDGRKTFNDVIVANDGISVTGDLNVDGNIVQSGAAVEVHVEEVYTKNDYIVMREDAATAIPPGQFSGLQVTKYNGVDDGRMVMDQSGTMRVGDVGQEEPLATRDETGDMTDGRLVYWDASEVKLKTSSVAPGDAVLTSGNQNIAGVKTFGERIKMSTSADVDINPYYDAGTQISTLSISITDPNDATNAAGLLLRFDASTNTAELILRKSVGGVDTYTTVGTL